MSPRIQRRWATVRALCGAVLLCLATTAAAALDEARLAILEIRLDGAVLSPGMPAYLDDGGGVLLPLGALCDLFEFAIDVEPARGRATGWIVEESRTFTLDLATGEVFSDGQARSLGAGEAVRGDDDIYVAPVRLAEWLPCDFEVRTASLVALVTSRETLPVQKRRLREQARGQRLMSKVAARAVHPVQKAEYQMFTWPLLDANVEYRGRSGDMTPVFSVQSAGDLARLETSFLVAHVDRERFLGVARARAGRSDLDGELLGPLHATEFQFGDLYAPSTPLVLRGKLGRGVSLGNRPLYRSESFDATNVPGEAPPGWEVELYVDGVLWDFTVVDEGGRYLFENVPVNFGRTLLRTVVYGPQGQTREQVRAVTIGERMIASGEVQYRLFGVQDDRFLITGEDQFADSPGRSRWTSHAEAGFGVTRSLSLTGAWTRSPLADVDHDYRTLIADAVVRGAALRGLLAADNTGGTARSLAVQGGLFGRTVQFEHAAFSDFVSDANTPQRRRTSDTTLRLGGGLHLGARPYSYDLRLQATSFADRDIERQDGAVLRLATGWSRATWTGKLDYRRSGVQGDDDRRLRQEHLLSSWWGPLLLRGQLRSGITPDFSLESAGASAGWQASRFLRLGAHVERDLQDQGTTGYGGSLTLLLDGVQVALSGHGASGQETFLSVGVSTSLTKVPETMRLHVQRTRLTGGYGATARVFLDRNANGLYDDRDEPLSDVRFAGGGALRHATTDRLGLAYLPDLPAHDARDIALDVESLQDPYLIPALQAVRAVGHPGAHLALEFPVTYSGDIEGTIFVQTPAGRTPLRNVGLELLDLKHRTVKTTVSEFDGYYLFQGIPPGWYEVHVIESSLARRNLRATPPLAAAVPVDGGVVAGNDFVLKFATPATVNR
jgi:hypothetical protein